MKESFRSLFRDHTRQKLTILLAAFLVILVLFTGIFSYLQSRDSVSNRMTGRNGSVTLLEPEWDRSGQELAKAAEPGMQIPKDPYGYNDGQADLYVRLVMTVELGAFDTSGKTEAYRSRYNADEEARDQRRLRSIAEAIQYVSGGTAVPLLTLDSTGDVKDWTITSCENADFVYDPANHAQTDDELVFYFYYTAGDREGSDDMMHLVAPDGSTARLFQRVDIPVYKEDYFGVFDQRFQIRIQAQAVPAADYPDGLKAEDAAGAFDASA
ncbi:MAG: hypothetical protein IJ055_02750 [Oscillospiraceae bacterium]|nr:hypothetical protein [Oscillospiraceae bacterium]